MGRSLILAQRRSMNSCSLTYVYNLYTSRNGLYGPTGVGSTGANPNAGEDPRVIGISFSHYF